MCWGQTVADGKTVTGEKIYSSWPFMGIFIRMKNISINLLCIYNN